jgi:two-component system phosphate regulon sensor histidine kinase PhoR
MWIALLIFLAAGAVSLNAWWLKRCRKAEREVRELRREVVVLREHQEATIQEESARRGAMFNSMLEGFLLLDGSGRVQTVNEALKEIFSLDRDIRGQTLIEAFRLHELSKLAERVEKEGQVRGYELKLQNSGGPKFLEISAAPITAGYKRFGTLFIFHDVTRLEELENMRRDFVANVSHELRTPLTLIKGFVETLLDGAKEDPALTAKFLTTIQKHTNRLTFLIEDLLTISKLESGQIAMQREWLDLSPLVNNVLEELHGTAEKKNIALDNHVRSDQTIFADEERLRQVLFNLIENAIKYGDHLVTISADERDKKVEICIADQGPGIPPDSLERIFERFYRVDRGRSREQGGTGLGLSIVKHIVQPHGGMVWAESNSGEGARFYFTLPVPVDATREKTQPVHG